MKEPRGDTDGIVGALGERLAAGVEHGTTTLRLALAETRLAATSAALLVGIALGAFVLAILIWLLLLALAGLGLWSLGLSPALALLVLLGVHLVAALALGLLARRLMGDLRFAHTRRALAGPMPVDAPADAPIRETPRVTAREERESAGHERG